MGNIHHQGLRQILLDHRFKSLKTNLFKFVIGIVTPRETSILFVVAEGFQTVGNKCT